MNSKLHPLRKSPTLLTYIPEPRIQHILDSNNEGFFSKQFDPRNVIELMRKGNLFNRRTAVEPELNVEDVAEQEENKREE